MRDEEASLWAWRDTALEAGTYMSLGLTVLKVSEHLRPHLCGHFGRNRAFLRNLEE